MKNPMKLNKNVAYKLIADDITELKNEVYFNRIELHSVVINLQLIEQDLDRIGDILIEGQKHEKTPTD